MEKQELQARLSEGWSLKRIGEHVGRDPATVSYWLQKYGLQAVNRDRHAARGALERDELQHAAAAGLSIGEIAEEFGRSKATVRYWLRKYELQTMGGVARFEARAAIDAGERTLMRECPTHGSTEHVLEGRGYFRCARCRSAAVVKARKKLKERLVAEAGGQCILCGYNRHPRALEFHHIDPGEKAFGLGQRGLTRALEALRTEAQKCVLLCSNCHAEVEDGVAIVPLEYVAEVAARRK